jgi:hypothetical protein
MTSGNQLPPPPPASSYSPVVDRQGALGMALLFVEVDSCERYAHMCSQR